MNARSLFEMVCINRLLNFLFCSIFLLLLLIINLHTSKLLQCCSESCCFHQILSVRNHSLLQHLRLAVSKMEHDRLLDLGEVKLWWHVLIHLTISALLISGSSNIRREWHFKLRHSVTVHLRDYNTFLSTLF